MLLVRAPERHTLRNTVIRCARRKRVPASPEKGGANEQYNDELHVWTVLIMIALAGFIASFVIEGGIHMIATLSLHLAVGIVIEFVRRAERITMFIIQ